MRIVLFGATGMIGSQVAAEARRRGHEITGVTRGGKSGTRAADASDPDTVARLVSGHDAVVLAVSPPRGGSESTESLLEVGRGVLDGVRKAGTGRLIVVGGSGAVEVAPGVRAVDAAGFPEELLPRALAQIALLELIRDSADDLEWSYISPPMVLEPGVRTGAYRTGGDQFLVDSKGESRISVKDYAVALVDELEKGAHIHHPAHVAY